MDQFLINDAAETSIWPRKHSNWFLMEILKGMSVYRAKYPLVHKIPLNTLILPLLIMSCFINIIRTLGPAWRDLKSLVIFLVNDTCIVFILAPFAFIHFLVIFFKYMSVQWVKNPMVSTKLVNKVFMQSVLLNYFW